MLPDREMVPLGTEWVAPSAAEHRAWLDLVMVVQRRGYAMDGLRGPYWFTRMNEDDDGAINGLCRRVPGGYVIYLRTGLGADLPRVAYHELGHAFDAEWDDDLEGREARADAFAAMALAWLRGRRPHDDGA